MLLVSVHVDVVVASPTARTHQRGHGPSSDPTECPTAANADARAVGERVSAMCGFRARRAHTNPHSLEGAVKLAIPNKGGNSRNSLSYCGGEGYFSSTGNIFSQQTDICGGSGQWYARGAPAPP